MVILSAPDIPGLKHEFKPLQVILQLEIFLKKYRDPQINRCPAQVSSPNRNKDMGQSVGPSNFLKK
jgi:hypothetical protein